MSTERLFVCCPLPGVCVVFLYKISTEPTRSSSHIIDRLGAGAGLHVGRTVVPLSELSDYCRTTVGPLSDHCRTTVGLLSEFTVGLSDQAALQTDDRGWSVEQLWGSRAKVQGSWVAKV